MGGHRPPLQLLEHELEGQLHDSWISSRQDFPEVRVVECRNGNSSAIAICEVKGIRTSFDTHILLKAEDSRQSRIDFPKAGARKAGPAGVAKGTERGLYEGRRIEPAPGIRVIT